MLTAESHRPSSRVMVARAPNKSAQSSLLIRMDMALRKRAEKAARESGENLTEWIRQAMRKRLEWEGR